MKNIVLLLVIAASASASSLKWTDLRVKFNMWFLDPFRWNSFFQIPRTLDDAVCEDWVEVTGANTTWVQMYCMKDDPLFAVLFDSHGYICGVQVAMPESDAETMAGIYNVSKFKLYQNKTMMGKKYVTATAYTVDPAVIKTGGRSDWGNTTGDAGVWLETTDGYVEIPRFVTDLDSVWTKEAYIAGMGTHYYYAMNETTACEDIPPWSVLYNNGELHAILYQKNGPAKTTKRVWWEQIPALAIRPTIPNSPQCLIDWTDEYGVTSLHIFFSEKPWDTSC